MSVGDDRDVSTGYRKWWRTMRVPADIQGRDDDTVESVDLIARLDPALPA